MFTKRFSERIVHLCLATARPALVVFVALAAFAGLLLLLSSGPAPVTAAPAIMPLPPGLTAALTSFTLVCPASSTYGDNVTCTATASPATARGTVSFWDTFKGTSTEIGRDALDGSGQATVTTSSLAAGSHEIKAVYEGGNYDATESNVETLTVNKATPAVTVEGPGSSDYGRESSVTFTATVASGAGTPTGKVVFKGWGDDFETTLSDGKASFTPTELHDVGGPFDITAEYQGDDNFKSASGTKSHTVTKADTETELTSPLDESDYGQEVRFIASVSADPQGSELPTGEVDFYCDGTTISGCVDLSLGSPAICTTSDLIVGTHDITATYKGDSNFNVSTSDIITHTVNKTDSETTLESSANPSDYGQTVTFTATVEAAGMGSGTPTGTVAFKDGGTAIPECESVAVASAATCTKNDLSVGTHDITAEYSGDANLESSTSSTFVQTVNRLTTSTTLTSSSPTNTSVVSETVTFTATVTASTTPTGTVEFKDGTTLLATKTLDAFGVATFSTSSLSAGTHFMKAEYKGTSNFSPSSSSRLRHTVGAVGTTTTLASSKSPSVFGESVTFTATVKAGGTPVTSGQVTFKDGATTLGSDSLDGSGKATLSTSDLTAGTHPIKAEYGGTANFAGSESAVLDQVVNKADTAVAVSSSDNSSVFGQTVVFTATVTAVAPGAGTPTGTVQFKANGSAIGSPVPLSGGSASVSTSSLSVATHTITAEYTSDNGNFENETGAMSPDQVVSKANTTTTVTSAPNPSVEGQNVTITANVTADSPSTATPNEGTVQFSYNGTSIGGPVALVNGSASVTTSSLPVGTHTITAVYIGGDNFIGSSDSSTHTVSETPADLSVTKSDSPDPVNAGANLTYVINVTNNEAELVSVTLVDTLPSQVSFVSATPSQGSCSGTSTVTCDLGDLAASGGSATVTIVVNVPLTTPAGTVLSNTAQVNGLQSDTEETTVYRLPQSGDCNGDDAVDLADVWAIVRDIFDPTFQGTSGCDANEDKRVDAGDVPSTVLIMLRSLNAAPEPALSSAEGPALSSAEGPALSMPDEVSAAPGSLATVPVSFAAHGHSITSLVFSVDYDETWLTLDPTDRDGNGIPDALVFSLPGEFSYSVTFDGDDADGEVDIFIGDISPPLTSLSDGAIAFMILNVDSSPGRTEGAVRFSLDPAASFGDTSGQSVPGTATPTGRYQIYLPVLH